MTNHIIWKTYSTCRLFYPNLIGLKKMKKMMRYLNSFGLFWIISLFIASTVLAQPPAARVVVSEVFEKNLAPTREMIGMVDFDKQAGLSAEISGLIAKETIIEGKPIKKGDLLVQLNTDFVKKDLNILSKQVRQLDIKIENVQKNVTRYKSLVRQNATSEKTYDDLTDNLKELLVQKEILIETRAKRKLELIKSRIKAPFDGIVLAKMKTDGEWVAPGVSICTIAATDDIVARVAIPETFVRFIQVGQTLSLTVSALDDTRQGKVVALIPVADPVSKTFEVKISMAYSPKLIKNMSVAVAVPVSRPMTLKMIKRDALIQNQGKQFVYAVVDGKAKMLPVTIAAYAGELVGVTGPGLTVGLPVVIDGNERLRPAQPVKVIRPELK